MQLELGKAYRTYGQQRVVMGDPGKSLWWHFTGRFDDGREVGYYLSGVPFAGEREDVIASLWESEEPAYRPLSLSELCEAFLANRTVRFAGEPWAIRAVRRDRSLEIGNGSSMTVLSVEQLAQDATWNDDETRCAVLVASEPVA